MPEAARPTRPSAKLSRSVVSEQDRIAANIRHAPAPETLRDAPTLAETVPSTAPSAVSEASAAEASNDRADAHPKDLRAEAPRKNEDPLAHIVWIPTMRLRPGQKSWGTAEELRNGFFLEVPLPRDAPAGEARILIVPDVPRAQKTGKGAPPPAPLAAERRALEALSNRDNADTEGDEAARGFEERVAVEADQRALLLQVPPKALATGVYRVDLELYSEGAVRGRARFRLELVDE